MRAEPTSDVEVPNAIAHRLPGVCAVSGELATDLVDVRVTYTAPSRYLLLVFGLLFVWLASEHLTFGLPVTRRVRNRHRRLVGLALFLAMCTFVALLGALVLPGTASFLTLTAFAAATGYVVYRHRGAWVGLRWDGRVVRVRRCAPAFASAVEKYAAWVAEEERRRALVGWHPDPSGEHRLRWYDGIAWTAHVAS